MKMILVTGVSGQLGFEVAKELNRRGIESKGIDIHNFDITKKSEVIKFITDLKPISVIHCAGYTQVDKAETEKDKCLDTNCNATQYIASACKSIGSKMLYISTDYVFDGEKEGEYDINDKTNALSVYGKSKACGEQIVIQNVEKHFIVRTSWLFGKNGNNFINTMIKLGKEKKEIDVVCDQIGSPTYSVDLANFICELIQTDKYGIYHATNEGFCSWADLAEKALEIEKIECKIKRVLATSYKSAARRPLNSKLSKNSLIDNGFNVFPTWENAVERYLKDRVKGKEE
nr:dTDP-4-dehydrorhamnose reductase [Clostridium saccharoperbutylacetonicum]